MENQYKHLKSINIVGTIERIEWSSDPDFSFFLIENRKPFVIYNTPADKWKARREWNPDYIQSKIEKRLPVTSGPSPIFLYYDKTKPMANLKQVFWKEPANSRMMNMTHFFQALKQMEVGDNEIKIPEIYSNESYFYFSHQLDKIPELQKDILPSKWFKGGCLGRDSSNLWMGGPGVTAHTHYDSSHNYFVQLYGRKTFLLSPPSQLKYIYLFPTAHPSVRQSQVNFTQVDFQMFPKFQTIETYQTTLKPGEMLYLPPFWLHRVIAEDISISVNNWCEAEEIEIFYDTILTAPLPFESNWTKSVLAIALKKFSSMLIENILQNKESDRFLQYIFEQRYQPIFGKIHPNEIDPIFHYCIESQASDLEEFKNENGDIVKLNLEKFEEKVKLFVPFFERIENLSKEPEVRNVLLIQFIENLVEYFLGVANLNQFFQICSQQ